MEPRSRLMVIGYSFRDLHVNEVLARAIESGLRLFVIDPNGAELAFKLNESRARGQIVAPSALETMLKKSLIGASRRKLSEIFGVDRAEFNKILRFFAPLE